MRRIESVVVTTGGTKEAIDDVRFITNFSTGKFGYEIANVLAKSGYAVTVLCPKETPAVAGYTISDAIHNNFTDTESLKTLLLTQGQPSIIFHAAAVSDFKPKDQVEGKINSSQDSLVLEFEKTPKILPDLRKQYGNETFLVGFKLLSGVSRQELVQAALEQNKKNHLNLTVANDLSDLRDGLHPIILVTAEGGAINLVGNRKNVSENLVEFVKKRADVTWYHTERVKDLAEPSLEEKDKFSKLLKFAQDTYLLYDSSGNVSMKHGAGMIVTPRQVDKSIVKANEAAIAVVDHQNNEVYFQGGVKSSIDTAVSDVLYRRFPDIKYLLHFHNAWGNAEHKTSFPYPCGVKEEAEEILEQLGENTKRNEFAVELLHHGFLIGLPEGDLDRLQEEWIDAIDGFKTHLVDVHKEDAINFGVLKPIFSGTEIVGVIKEHMGGSVVYLSEKSRGRGVGRKVIEQLIERQMSIQTIDECGVVEFYKKFGFTGDKDPKTGFYTLRPPKIFKSDPIFDKIENWKVK